MGLFQKNNVRMFNKTATKDTSKSKVSPTKQGELHNEKTENTESDVSAHDANTYNLSSHCYSTGDLVNLFHSLPKQNLQAEISAVVRTLASFDININSMIDELTDKETLTKKRLKVLKLEIELFKAKIINRQKEMDLLEVGLSEMLKSKDYLQKGLISINKENDAPRTRLFTAKKSKKRIPILKRAMPIAEQIKMAASEEINSIEPNQPTNSPKGKTKRFLLKKKSAAV